MHRDESLFEQRLNRLQGLVGRMTTVAADLVNLQMELRAFQGELGEDLTRFRRSTIGFIRPSQPSLLDKGSERDELIVTGVFCKIPKKAPVITAAALDDDGTIFDQRSGW